MLKVFGNLKEHVKFPQQVQLGIILRANIDLTKSKWKGPSYAVNFKQHFKAGIFAPFLKFFVTRKNLV